MPCAFTVVVEVVRVRVWFVAVWAVMGSSVLEVTLPWRFFLQRHFPASQAAPSLEKMHQIMPRHPGADPPKATDLCSEPREKRRTKRPPKAQALQRAGPRFPGEEAPAGDEAAKPLRTPGRPASAARPVATSSEGGRPTRERAKAGKQCKRTGTAAQQS